MKLLLEIFLALSCSAILIFPLELPTSEDAFAQFPESIRLNYRELANTTKVFERRRLERIQTLILDDEREQVLIGAKNKVVRLDSVTLRELEELKWPPTEEEKKRCQMNGVNKEQCHNFIKTLAVHDDKVLVCGTSAYAPTCSWREATRLAGEIGSRFNGVGKTPYGPDTTNVALLTKSGQLYTGVPIDFSGQEPGIMRIIPKPQFIRNPRSSNRWLNEATFVAAHEVDPFIFFFFIETPLETENCRQPKRSRVARVCGNDIGGDYILNDEWTTFSKATLNCSRNGLSFDTLESIYFDNSLRIFFAAFTRSQDELFASAICLYDLDSIRAAFSGDYLAQEKPGSTWTKHINSDSSFHCQVHDANSPTPGLTKRSLMEAQNYQLMALPVQPISDPVDYAPLERYVKIVVDRIRVKNSDQIPVIFVATANGLLKKIPLYRNHRESCLVEVLQLQQNDLLPFTDIKISQESGGVFLSTEKMLMKIPLHRCARFSNQKVCLEAKDPYCGWNRKRNQCTPAPEGITSHAFWDQDLRGCPVSTGPVDGSFGEWGEWRRCPMVDEEGPVRECSCRRRQCDSPAPKRGGFPCVGITLQVSKCKRDGNWTEWSDWSACSASCGPATRSRSRTCTNPAPSHGGRNCVGEDRLIQTCVTQACPIPVAPPVHGGWSQWEAWGRCSRNCGGGIRKRERSCNSPAPANNGSYCQGCDTDFSICNSGSCEQIRRWSEWTPWLQSNATSTGSAVYLKRFKFACEARVDDPSLLGVSRAKAEQKLCETGGEGCSGGVARAVDGGWSDWEEWSSCSDLCGGGVQSRSRSCSQPPPQGSGADCMGHAREQRDCNTHSCQASWSCWKEYGECSASCGVGVKQRVRQCAQLPGMKPCEGASIESAPCDAGPCTSDGYGSWSRWSACNAYGVVVRIRPCISDSLCGGVPETTMEKCVAPGEAVPVEMRSEEQQNLILIIAVTGAFLGGIMIALILTCWALRSRSACCLLFGVKKAAIKAGPGHQKNRPNNHQLAPPKASNIYTPPPKRSLSTLGVNNGTLTVNPLNPLLGSQKALEMTEMPDLTDEYSSMTLRRNMRASLNTRDYL